MIKLSNLINRLFNKPQNLKFSKGEKVHCSITHEVNNSKITNGTIIKWAYKKKSYWAFSDKSSDWYKVKYTDGQTITLPEERLTNAEQYAEKALKRLELQRCKIGDSPGNSEESFNRLYAMALEAKKFSEA